MYRRWRCHYKQLSLAESVLLWKYCIKLSTKREMQASRHVQTDDLLPHSQLPRGLIKFAKCSTMSVVSSVRCWLVIALQVYMSLATTLHTFLSLLQLSTEIHKFVCSTQINLGNNRRNVVLDHLYEIAIRQDTFFAAPGICRSWWFDWPMLVIVDNFSWTAGRAGAGGGVPPEQLGLQIG